MKISLFKSHFSQTRGEWAPSATPEKESLEFDEYLNGIRGGRWQDVFLAVKTGQIKKTQAPSVTPSGFFDYRTAKNLQGHTGFMCVDFDAKDNPAGLPIDQLAADPFTYSMHRSISGNGGYKLYVKIDPKKHLEAFLGLEKYYADTYEIALDPSCKDVCRLCFVSFDPDLFINPKAKIFKQYIEVKQREPSGRVYTQSSNDIEFIINQVTQRGLNLANEYSKVLTVGRAFATTYGETGRGYFHAITNAKPNYTYQKFDVMYNGFLKNNPNLIGIGSFIWLAAQAGLETKTPETAYVESFAKTKLAQVGQNGGFKSVDDAKKDIKKQLKELDGIEGENIDKTIEIVAAMSPKEMRENQLTGDVFDDTMSYVKALGLRFNEVTRSVEKNGEDIRDMDINTIYINAKKTIGKGTSKSDIESMINSDLPERFNPFKEFFTKYSNAQPEGLVDMLLDCFIFENNDNSDYVAKMKDFILKWLTSVVAQMNGTYSILCLVLCGGQGISKTRFFRELLPPELSKYFAESTLDNGKDDELLMARKLIVLDDEFSGKSKKETEKMKAVLSKEMFYLRRPYGKVYEDVPRYAVLCGTSNNEEILTDVANRRVIPCNIKGFDYDKYKRIDKALLWMELYNFYNQVGNDWMLTKEDIADLKRLAKTNEQASQEEEAFLAFFKKPEAGDCTEFLTNTQIKMHIELNSRLKITPTKLGVILKALGIEKKPKKINSVTQLVYEVVKIQM